VFPGLLDPRLKSASLLLIVHREPVLQELDVVGDDFLFESRTDLEEALVLRIGAEPHHLFYPCPVVPTTIEDHHFTRCRQMASGEPEGGS
jgi:hypothetical protein